MRLRPYYYNRTARRWQRATPCGRLVWSKLSRSGLSYRFALHVRDCWRCRFLERFRYHPSQPAPHTLARLAVIAESAGMTKWAYWRDGLPLEPPRK